MINAYRIAMAMTWALSPEWLSTILAIANREGPGPEAVATQLGRPLANTQTMTMRGGVAVLPILGPIFPRANALTDVSGCTSVAILARDFAAAVRDPAVKAIVLEIDSPGGAVTGIHEFASQVFAARGTKPIVAYVGGACCSAAYWIGSGASEVVVDATAQVGSIGVVRAIPNATATSAKDIEIVSSQSPRKNPDPATKSGRADLQAQIDATAAVFVADVARFRGVEPAKVLADFGQGGVFVGEASVKAGLATSVGSLEGTIARLNAQASRPESKPASRVIPIGSTPKAVERWEDFSPDQLAKMHDAEPARYDVLKADRDRRKLEAKVPRRPGRSRWSAMTTMEKHNLAHSDPAAYIALRDEHEAEEEGGPSAA